MVKILLQYIDKNDELSGKKNIGLFLESTIESGAFTFICRWIWAGLKEICSFILAQQKIKYVLLFSREDFGQKLADLGKKDCIEPRNRVEDDNTCEPLYSIKDDNRGNRAMYFFTLSIDLLFQYWEVGKSSFKFIIPILFLSAPSLQFLYGKIN